MTGVGLVFPGCEPAANGAANRLLVGRIEGVVMDVQVLGEIQAVSDEPLAVGGPTQRRVLAALALRRNEVVSVQYLVD
jgi:hypothetical protein